MTGIEAVERSDVNPLFGGNRLKLGLFGLNGPVIAMTRAPERFTPTWAGALEIVESADRAGYEAIIPYARFNPLSADPRHYSARVFDNFTWAAAMAARTSHSCIMATAQITSIHPLHAAKAIATIDHVSGGRFALNIVMGNAAENATFGTDILSRDQRYDYAEEWTTLVKRLWAEDDFVDFTGDFVRVKRAVSQPKPLQRPYPGLMNAAKSEAGQAFAARHCDLAFIRENERAPIAEQAASYRRLAREEYGRDIQIWCNCTVVQRASRTEAEAYVRYYTQEMGDDAEVFIRDNIQGSEDWPTDLRRRVKADLKRGNAGLPLLGNAVDIATAIASVADQGIDGILLNWVDPSDGIRRFNAEVLPLLQEAGLRQPASI